MLPLSESAPPVEYPGLALLMHVIERQLGTTLDQAALKCRELADELTRTIAVADNLMQRVSRSSVLEERMGLSKDVKEYARATLKTESLVSELQEQVERGDAVMRLLGDSSVGRSAAETDAESLIQQLSEFLRADLGESVTLDVVTKGPCVVPIGRPTVLCILCAAVENALENIRAAGARGHVVLKTCQTDDELVIEVADDGIPGFTELRVGIVDSLVADTRKTKLRQLRERVRGLGGELTVDTDDGGTLISIYLPVGADSMRADPMVQIPKVRLERQNQ
jgi:signal transduction histidine kinase